MKAVLYEKRESPPALLLRDVPVPVPGDDEVLVKIAAVSVNAADYRSMRLGIVPPRKIFGADVAGVVETAGKNVSHLRPGDAVVGELSESGFGGFAEYVAAPARLLVRKPGAVSFQDVAALPMASVTALQGLRDAGRVQPGEQVLVYGAGGGVGTFAVQLARNLGARVTAVCGPNNLELVRSLGAERVVDYTKEDILQTGGIFDCILAVNGKRSLLAYHRALKPRGRLVMVGGGIPQILTVLVFGRLLSLGGKKMRTLAAKSDPLDLEWIMSQVEAQTIRPVIDRVFPLDQTAQAVAYAAHGHARGKVVIAVTGQP